MNTRKIRKDPLVAAKERLAKAISKQTELDTVLADMIGVYGKPQNDREREVLQLKAKRETAYMRLETVLNQIAALRAGNTSSTNHTMEELVARKLELFETINAMPDLGYTQAEWDSRTDSSVKKSVGRPAVSIEQNIIRTRKEVEELMAKIQEMDPHADLDEVFEMAKDPNVVDKKNGRPKNDALSNLDYDLKMIRQKIHYITSGEAQKHIEERLKNSIYSDSGKRLGRNFQDPSVKLQKYREKEARIMSLIQKAESQLSGTDLINRQIKLKKDERNVLRREIKNDAVSNKQELEAQLESVLKDLQALEAKRVEILGQTKTAIRGKQYVKPEATVQAAKPAVRVQIRARAQAENADETVAPQMSAAEMATQAALNHKRSLDENQRRNTNEIKQSHEETRSRIDSLVGGRKKTA
ncbi:hypothetical protein ACI2KR_07335 [Pseudomonas luteola]